MRRHAALRAAAVTLALSVCALLLGLSVAHHTLPGDTFQVARTAVVAPGAEPRTSDWDSPPVALAAIVDAHAVPPRSETAGETATVLRGRPVGNPGCRGPPLS